MELDWNSLSEKASMPIGADTSEPPTVKQVRFLEDLVETRDAPKDIIDDYYDTVDIGGLTKKKASYLIDAFLRYPKMKRKKRSPDELIASLDSPEHRDFRNEVKTVPAARYAVPFDELFVEFLKTPVTGDLIFVEVTERYGPKKMKRLTGAPGSFSRSDLHIDDALAVLRVIARSPYDYTSMFARHYKVCGRCGAELTDPKSRDIGLGPECRKHFSSISMMAA